MVAESVGDVYSKSTDPLGVASVVRLPEPTSAAVSQPVASVEVPTTGIAPYVAIFAVASVSAIVAAVPAVGVTPSGKAIPGSVPSWT